MNIDDLRKLKEQLEKEQTYAIVDSLDINGIMNAHDAKTLAEHETQERTDELVKECEALIENTVRCLGKNGIPYNTIVLSSQVNFLMKSDFIERLLKYYDESDKDIDGELFSKLLDELDYHISTIYTPLKFFLNLPETRNEYMSIEDYRKEKEVNYDDISELKIFGIVNFEEFIYKMKTLGYDVKFVDGEDCLNISNYIQALKDSLFATYINICVDFKKTQNPKYKALY